MSFKNQKTFETASKEATFQAAWLTGLTQAYVDRKLATPTWAIRWSQPFRLMKK